MLPKILIVDDDQDTLDSLRRMFRKHAIILPVNPSRPYTSALEIWANNDDLTLAVVDLDMPDSSGRAAPDAGFRLIEELRRVRPAASFAIHTAHYTPENQERGKKARVDAFVPRNDVRGDLMKWLQPHRRHVVPRPPDEKPVHAEDLEGRDLGTHRLSELELLHEEAVRWCVGSLEVRLRYGGLIAAVTPGKVWAAGASYPEALESALGTEGCPVREQLALVSVPFASAGESPDLAWCLADAQARQRYAGHILAVHGRRILGAGLNRRQALEAARSHPDCPPLQEVRLVVL